MYRDIDRCMYIYVYIYLFIYNVLFTGFPVTHLDDLATGQRRCRNTTLNPKTMLAELDIPNRASVQIEISPQSTVFCFQCFIKYWRYFFYRQLQTYVLSYYLYLLNALWISDESAPTIISCISIKQLIFHLSVKVLFSELFHVHYTKKASTWVRKFSISRNICFIKHFPFIQWLNRCFHLNKWNYNAHINYMLKGICFTSFLVVLLPSTTGEDRLSNTKFFNIIYGGH